MRIDKQSLKNLWPVSLPSFRKLPVDKLVKISAMALAIIFTGLILYTSYKIAGAVLLNLAASAIVITITLLSFIFLIAAIAKRRSNSLNRLPDPPPTVKDEKYVAPIFDPVQEENRKAEKEFIIREIVHKLDEQGLSVMDIAARLSHQQGLFPLDEILWPLVEKEVKKCQAGEITEGKLIESIGTTYYNKYFGIQD
jgi:hypothetical protein